MRRNQFGSWPSSILQCRINALSALSGIDIFKNYKNKDFNEQFIISSGLDFLVITWDLYRNLGNFKHVVLIVGVLRVEKWGFK